MNPWTKRIREEQARVDVQGSAILTSYGMGRNCQHSFSLCSERLQRVMLNENDVETKKLYQCAKHKCRLFVVLS